MNSLDLKKFVVNAGLRSERRSRPSDCYSLMNASYKKTSASDCVTICCGHRIDGNYDSSEIVQAQVEIVVTSTRV